MSHPCAHNPSIRDNSETEAMSRHRVPANHVVDGMACVRTRVPADPAAEDVDHHTVRDINPAEVNRSGGGRSCSRPAQHSGALAQQIFHPHEWHHICPELKKQTGRLYLIIKSAIFQ